MSDNLANEQDVKRRDQKAKLGRERELSDLRVVLSTREGRRFIWRYLCESGVFRTSFTGNSYTYFNEGRREIGIRLMADIDAAQPEAYFQMGQEAKNEELNHV